MIRKATEMDWPDIRAIYIAGIKTNHATFESADAVTNSYEDWLSAKVGDSVLVKILNDRVAGWSALSSVSDRCVYSGVAEVSVYVSEEFQNQGIGSALLQEIVKRSEEAGIWTLQAGIFPENLSSVSIHHKYGFRTVGKREKLGKQNGVWRDVLFLERRSEKIL